MSVVAGGMLLPSRREHVLRNVSHMLTRTAPRKHATHQSGPSLYFADVLVPQFGPHRNELLHQPVTLGVINDLKLNAA
jgi:hypothetical protein